MLALQHLDRRVRLPHLLEVEARCRTRRPAAPRRRSRPRAAMRPTREATSRRRGCLPRPRPPPCRPSAPCPLEQWECTSTGILTPCLSAATSSQVGLRAEQARGVLDHDLVAAHVREALGDRDPQLDVVGGRDRVAERALHLLLGLERRADRGLHVPKVVERIEDAEHVDTAFRCVLDEELDRVVREVPAGRPGSVPGSGPGPACSAWPCRACAGTPTDPRLGAAASRTWRRRTPQAR